MRHGSGVHIDDDPATDRAFQNLLRKPRQSIKGYCHCELVEPLQLPSGVPSIE